MKKQRTNRPLLTEELEQINFDGTEQEVRELFEQEALPSPSELEKYDQLMPGGAERVFNLIEDERMHKREMDLKQISGRNRLNQLISASGLVLGAIIVVVLILAPFIKSSLSKN